MVPSGQMVIKSRTMSEERYQELTKAEDRDAKVLYHLRYVYDSVAPGDEIDRITMSNLIKLYDKELNPKFSDGTQIFPNRKD